MTAGGPQARHRRITWEAIAALVAASLIAALGTWALMRTELPAPALPARFTITFPPTAPMELSFRGRDIAFSPDGRYIAYQSRGRLMLRALDQLDAVLLSSVTGGRTPFFSPDSRWIGFFDGGDLKKVAVTGEPVITLCRELGEPEGGTWGDDGTIVVSSGDGNVGLMRVSADGGEATVLTRTDAARRTPVPDDEGEQRRRSEPSTQYGCRPQLVRGAETACADSIARALTPQTHRSGFVTRSEEIVELGRSDGIGSRSPKAGALPGCATPDYVGHYPTPSPSNRSTMTTSRQTLCSRAWRS
jgi:hypothetical protein